MNRPLPALSSRAGPAALTALTALVALACLVPAEAGAQAPGYTRGHWSQVETEHFLFLYPNELTEWALDMATRMEAVHAAVADIVGFVPEDRVTVLMDDPGNVSNGSMTPGPLLYMWPTPPNPRSMIGENRGWGEILAVHEFAHAAHLTRPSRNPTERLRSSVIPLPVTRIMRSTPRWATEGYATYVEGRLTGSGRPHGVWRPAVLRTWALEGQLPTYAQVSGSSGFYGGAMAYLLGSAYLEWLVEREGGEEEVLPNVWRRLTARQRRSFDEAFTGVFGAPPAELYGRFTVDVTERALAVEDAVEAAGGVVDGDLFQRLSWYVGDPAVAPDGQHLALQLTSRDGPSRLVVMATTPDTMTSKERERYEKIFAEDPDDVEPVQRRPRRQKEKATLSPTLGMAYTAPAWMPDGEGILLVRSDVESNARTRPDLFLWRWEDDELRRITRGAAIREAAPAPDGSWVVGLRCLHASCDIVRIEIGDGAVTALTDTEAIRPYYHPRVSPDGSTIVASVQIDGEWRLTAMDVDGSNERLLGPADGAARFDAEFLPDGRLILTSTLGGIHDLEILDPATGQVTPLTRVLGSAVSPATGEQGDIFFLSLHSRGWDLRRIAGDAPSAAPRVHTDPAAFPAATVPLEPGDTFPPAEIGPVRPYGLGPRFRILLPMVHLGEDGYGGGLALGGTDPIGRLSWQLQGMYGSERAPVGGSLRLRYRGTRPWLHVEGFWTRDALASAEPPLVIGFPTLAPSPWPLPLPLPVPEHGDDGYYGAMGALELQRERLSVSHGLRAGGSVGRVEGLADRPAVGSAEAFAHGDGTRTRLLGFGELELDFRQGPGHWRLEQSIDVHGAVGRTGSMDWTRWVVSGTLAYRGQEHRGLALSGTLGGTDAATGSVEEFTVGGAAPLLHDPALLSQRLSMPALARGTLRGDELRAWAAELDGLLSTSIFYWAGDVAGDGRDWYRVAGTRTELNTPPIPFVRLPSIRIQTGLARLLDDPGKDDWRGWLMLGFMP